MAPVFTDNILPIFSIIFLGYVFMRRGFFTQSFIQTANRLVYYVAVPTMLFYKVAQCSFRENYEPRSVISILAALIIVFLCSTVAVRPFGLPAPSRISFMHSSFHGNLGYMGYAVAYYALGEKAFAQTALLSSFLMIAHNILAILVFAFWNKGESSLNRSLLCTTGMVRQIVKNPIILSVLAGIIWSFLGFPIPVTLERSLNILSNMALPMALILIGTSFTFHAARKLAHITLAIGTLKLLLFPLIGLSFMYWFVVPHQFRLPALILMATPPATGTYVMAAELGGDQELAATSISVLTLLSGLTYACFLALDW